MKKIKREKIYIILLALIVCWLLFNALRTGEYYHQKRLEAFLVPGMTMEKAVIEIEKRGYDVSINKSSGAWFPDEADYVGDMSLRFSVHQFKAMLVFDGDITALVAFDRNGRLVRVEAWRTVDAL